MQGSGSFAVESVLGSAIPRDGKILIINNGAYGAYGANGALLKY